MILGGFEYVLGDWGWLGVIARFSKAPANNLNSSVVLKIEYCVREESKAIGKILKVQIQVCTLCTYIITINTDRPDMAINFHNKVYKQIR